MSAKIAPQPIFGIGEPFTNDELREGVWIDAECGETYTLEDVIEDCNAQLEMSGWRAVTEWFHISRDGLPDHVRELVAMPGHVLTVAEFSNGQPPEYCAVLTEIYIAAPTPANTQC